MLPATVENRTKVRGLLARPLEEVGAGEVGQRPVILEVAVGPVPPGVDDPLGDPLVVEVEDLLAEVEVFQERRAADAGLERVLVVGDRDALLGGQDRMALGGDLVGLAPRAGRHILGAIACGLASVVFRLGHARTLLPR